tara:strand:+ start:56222 stop:56851 length:630 start_codon:yes stop_codon:yes gene_type:complete
MSLSENQAIERIANSGREEKPEDGWQAAVFRTIRNEAPPVRLRLVTQSARDVRVSHSARRSLLFGGLTFAAVIFAFFLVLDQRPDDRITKRTAAIAMVVDFIELESEMANALAEMDITEARMDLAFRELQKSQPALRHSQPALRHTQPALRHTQPAFPRISPVLIDDQVPQPYRAKDVPRLLDKSPMNRKKTSAIAMPCGDAGDLSCER